MSCLSSFFKETINNLKVYVIIISLFTFYYFAIPEYWFLCSIFTIIIYGIIKIVIASKKVIKVLLNDDVTFGRIHWQPAQNNNLPYLTLTYT
ncbi:hypothetical protein YA22_07930 [Klebsiella aerogenes]|nr:hypothetical protein YA22_07930 [Klebsiella aerogenes]VAG18190.1 Uncharacterised protein [Klebsiella aerogenes]